MYNNCSKSVYNLLITNSINGVMFYTAKRKQPFFRIFLFINHFFKQLRHKFSTRNKHPKIAILLPKMIENNELSTVLITTTNL